MSILDASLHSSMDGAPTFSLRNRLYRVAWNVCWTLLAAWTPPQLNPWRLLLLRLFGARVHRTAKVYGSARIWYPAYLAMDRRSCLGRGAIAYNMAPIELGAYCVISQRAHLCAGTHDIENLGFQLQARPILIGARAWIAAEAFVGPGVTIGAGAVLGARACAMRDIEPWAVCTGNPAVKLRERRVRFPENGRPR